MTTTLVLAAAGLLALLAITLIRMMAARRPAVRLRPVRRSGIEQYIAHTPAGPAVVTKVLNDDSGWAYEVETSFRGQRTRLYYVAPALAVVRRRLDELTAEHQQARETRRVRHG